jgi:hypothetical protein
METQDAVIGSLARLRPATPRACDLASRRFLLTIAFTTVLFAGCLESREGQLVADPGTLRIEVETTTDTLVRTVCYSATVTVESGASPSIHGAPGRLFDTVAEAEQAGAICGERLDPDTDFTHVGTLTVPCEAGDGTVVVSPAGAFDADGFRLGEEDVRPESYLGGNLPFVCVAATETVVSFDFILWLRSRQGFVDIGVNGAPPDGASAVCYAVRVSNGDGLVVWADPAICSNDYGDDEGGSITYVGFCDSRAPDNTLTLWVTSALGPDGNTLADPKGPCTDGAREGDPLTWTGGCAREVTCVENYDVPVLFDLPNLSGQTP